MKKRFDRFTSAVSSINQSIIRIKKEEMKKYGLRSGHVDCLHLLYDHPDGLSSKEISILSDMDKAAVSRYMEQMEEVGFAYMDEDENKVYGRKWMLSEKGLETARYVDEKIIRTVETIGALISDEERTILYKTLEQIDQNIKDHLNNTGK